MPVNNFDTRAFYNKSKDSEVIYTGDDYPDLNIKNGDSLNSVLTKVADTLSQISQINTRLASLEASLDLDSSKVKAVSALYDLVDESAVISHILQDKQVDIKVTNSTYPNQVDVFFDFSGAIESLDSKYIPVGIDTSIRTYGTSNKLLGSSSSRTGTLAIDKLSGPVIVNSKINLKSIDGDIVLSKSFYIPNLIPQEMGGKFKVSGIATTESNNISQKEFNEVVASNLSKVVKDIAALEKKLPL